MLNTDAFLTALYVTCDDFCKAHLPVEKPCRGPAATLSRSETICLCVFAQFSRFASERDFYRFAQQRLKHLFVRLPNRSQFSRLQRQHQSAILAFGLHLAKVLDCQSPCAVGPYEVLDRCGVKTRWCSRRGAGWLPEYADKGKCSRLGFFHGFSVLTAVTAQGAITGFGVGAASAKDQPLAEAFFAARHAHDERLPSAGEPFLGRCCFVVDKGFCGPRLHRRWHELFGVRIFCAPRKSGCDGPTWPKPLCSFLASLRQIVETVHDKLLNTFRLDKERPHAIEGFFTRLAAKVALHNFCILLNKNLDRENLAFADLLDW